ncbi:copper resistance CopC family protein, partial [Mycobacterium tuberculosis]|uniref:copper resistance CopC family protein n=1 Tax=Mycobacterium tuberculosis TaxID=1773 RepID=UPI001F4306D4
MESSPADGERLEAPPTSVTMTFSGELLVLDESTAGAVVLVVDTAGKDWATGEVDVRGRTVTAALPPGMPEGGYQVRWQVVSEDGHPIAGLIPFA